MEDNLAAEVGTTRPIIGWRAWCVRWSSGVSKDSAGLWQRSGDTGPRLVSWTNDYEWPPFRALTAAEGARGECQTASVSHPKRGRSCHCGIYAFKGKRHLITSLQKEMRDGLVAFGRVSLWGNWVGGTKGWRAEYAYPYDIKLVSTNDSGLARAVAEAYAIDVSYGVWDPYAELGSAGHDCQTEGHLYAEDTLICETCGIAREQAEALSATSHANRAGLTITPPDFTSRDEALDWYRETAFEIMQDGIASGDEKGAQERVNALTALMRPILSLAPVRRAPRALPTTRLGELLDKRLPRPA